MNFSSSSDAAFHTGFASAFLNGFGMTSSDARPMVASDSWCGWKVLPKIVYAAPITQYSSTLVVLLG